MPAVFSSLDMESSPQRRSSWDLGELDPPKDDNIWALLPTALMDDEETSSFGPSETSPATSATVTPKSSQQPRPNVVPNCDVKINYDDHVYPISHLEGQPFA